MRRLTGLLALLAVAVLIPATAHARGYGKSGVVMTPYGPAYNTSSPEWRAAGGNIYMYQEIMQQKMALQQQQMYLKQQQLLQKQNGNKTGVSGTNGSSITSPTLPPINKRKKRRTLVSQGQTATSTTSTNATTSTPDASTPKQNSGKTPE